jgi:DNA-binding transcriptional ArsR family regulator
MNTMSHVSSLFGALSDPCRLEVIEVLMRDGEKSAGDICEMFDISGPAVSRHLSVLHRNGLVSRRVAGKHRLYSVRPEAIKRVSDWTLNHRHFWEASMDRIEAALSEDSS